VNVPGEVARSRSTGQDERTPVRRPMEFPTEWCLADEAVDAEASERCTRRGQPETALVSPWPAAVPDGRIDDRA